MVNINNIWSRIILAALYYGGVRRAYVSPGYRNAPLIHALLEDGRFDIYSAFDERSGAYRALGAAKASGEPSLLIATSGTAAANYLPAVIEAHKQQLPLVALSADRPYELIYAGANQVMEQPGLFGCHVRACLNLPTAHESLPAPTLVRYIKQLIRSSRSYPAGPVHINLPFREPLEPGGPQVSAAYALSFEQCLAALLAAPPFNYDRAPRLDDTKLNQLANAMRACSRGLLILGESGRSESDAYSHLALQLGWPVFKDVLAPQGNYPNSIQDPRHPETYAWLSAYRPDFILHLGRRLTTKWFDKWIGESFSGHYTIISTDESLQDPSHKHTERLYAHEDHAAAGLVSQLKAKGEAPDQPLAQAPQPTDHSAVSIWGFEALAHKIWTHPQPEGRLFLGNSLSIRVFDEIQRQYRGKWPVPYANRGVSGIEGLVATAIGLAEGTQELVTLVLGDISLLHDLNSLIALGAAQAKVLVVVANNHRGAIFDSLPVSQFEEVLDPFMSTPHRMHFHQIAQMAGLRYGRVDHLEQWPKVYNEFLVAKTSGLIECVLSQP